MIRVRKPELDAVKVASPVLMNRGKKLPSDSRFKIYTLTTSYGWQGFAKEK